MPLESMYDLFMDELREAYHAERQLLMALPAMARAAKGPALRTAIESQLGESEDHACRLEQVFAELGMAPQARFCRGMAGLMAEARDVMNKPGVDAVCDAALIGVAQRIEHYRIAAYHCLIGCAQTVGELVVAELLSASLDEAEAAGDHLLRIADEDLHAVAAATGNGA